MKTVDGKLVAVAGKSRSGKTAWVVRDVEKQRFDLLFAWDPDGQWCELKGWRKFSSLKALAQAVAKSKKGKFALVCDGDTAELKAQFDALCEYIFGVAQAPDRPEKIGFIPEELADVTTTAKAPPGWGKLIRRVLKRNVWLYPISQRWAEADKTALNNASAFVCCAMRSQDVAYMAAKTGIAAEELAALKKTETATHIHCMYIYCDPDNDKIERGTMTFRKTK